MVSRIKWEQKTGPVSLISFRLNSASDCKLCTASEQPRLLIVSTIDSCQPKTCLNFLFLYLIIYITLIFLSFTDGHFSGQADRGWAGKNNGWTGWVGETTASSHQHRRRCLRFVVVIVSWSSVSSVECPTHGEPKYASLGGLGAGHDRDGGGEMNG